MSEPIAKLTLYIPGPAVGENALYVRAGRKAFGNGPSAGKGLILSKEGHAYKERIARIALAERTRSGWPADPYLPSSVRVTVRICGTRHDAGAADKAVRDALEGVLYANDRIVINGEQRPADPRGDACTEIDVELLVTRDPHEAAKLAAHDRDLAVARQIRKNAKKRPLPLGAAR